MLYLPATLYLSLNSNIANDTRPIILNVNILCFIKHNINQLINLEFNENGQLAQFGQVVVLVEYMYVNRVHLVLAEYVL